MSRRKFRRNDMVTHTGDLFMPYIFFVLMSSRDHDLKYSYFDLKYSYFDLKYSYFDLHSAQQVKYSQQRRVRDKEKEGI